ncbi:MAG: hypothetical protein IIA45_02935 [Bacteroidetes bacterium]|nr:hypothetical protein [Bacteroidota bacterium]
MKRILILGFLLFTALFLNAQTENTSKALKYLQEGELDSARIAIDSAALDESTAAEPTTWYYKGFIYKELYKKKEIENPSSGFREEAMRSFQQSMLLDTAGRLLEDNVSNINFLASSHYNDAIKTLNVQDYQISIRNFNQYKIAKLSIDSTIKLTDREIEYNLGLSTVYVEISESDSSRKDEFLQKAKDAYSLVIQLDQGNLSANYNMGIIYYNEAVDMILNLPYDVDLIILSTTQDNCIKLFKQSLPHMELAITAEPDNVNTLEGLAGIYYSLNEFDKSNEYKSKIEQILQDD